MSRTIGNEISPGIAASSGTGPTEIIWWTAGVSGMCTPAIFAILGLHTPQATTIASHSMSPPVVRTLVTLPPSTSMPDTSTFATVVRAPSSTARSRMIVPARTDSTTPTVGDQKPPTITLGSRKGTFSCTCAGVCSSASTSQQMAEVIRRVSSCIRSGERATSYPPDWVNTPSSVYWRTLSRVRSVISREWSTGKMKLLAWPVEPPGLGSGPLSICTRSRQPRRARW